MRDLVFGVVLAVAFIIMMGIGFIIKSRVPKTITNSIGMQMVLISSGTFMMGSPPSDKGSLRNERQHEVTLSQDYYLGAFEVTQDQYEQVMGKNPSFFPSIGNMNSSNHPVERVSWFDAKNFCRKLSELPEEKKAGRVYRLPTEAEWEYACRAGSQTSFSFGENLGSLFHFAWFGGNSRETQPVGQKNPMLGACTTCTVMCGSGAVTCTVMNTPRVR